MTTPPRSSRHPVRVAHLGLGAFHRSHQAWYTQAANDAGGDWGIAAFTGRRPDAARVLAAQDAVYTLVTRGPAEDGSRPIEAPQPGARRRGRPDLAARRWRIPTSRCSR